MTRILGRADLRRAVLLFDKSRAETARAFIARTINLHEADARFDRDLNSIVDLLVRYGDQREAEGRISEINAFLHENAGIKHLLNRRDELESTFKSSLDDSSPVAHSDPRENQ